MHSLVCRALAAVLLGWDPNVAERIALPLWFGGAVALWGRQAFVAMEKATAGMSSDTLEAWTVRRALAVGRLEEYLTPFLTDDCFKFETRNGSASLSLDS